MRFHLHHHRKKSESVIEATPKTKPVPINRSPSPRKLPPPPETPREFQYPELNRDQLLDSIKEIPAKDLHWSKPNFLQLIDNKFKRKRLLELIKELDDDVLNQEELMQNESLKYYSQNLDNISLQKCELLTIDYPTVNDIPTELSKISSLLRFKHDEKVINVTDYLYNLENNNDISTISNRRPHSISNFSDLTKDSKNTFKKYSKRLSQITEQNLSAVTSSNSTLVETSNQIKLQNFIKYHVFQYENTLLLTTNPSRKHLYCRFNPGFTIEVQKPNKVTNQTINKPSDLGFRLIFNENVANNFEAKPRMVITKKGVNKGNNYVIWLFDDEKKDYLNYELLENNQLRPLKALTSSTVINRYNFNDDWMIGSIPKIKENNFNNYESLHNKYNVYFFSQNFKAVNLPKLYEPNNRRIENSIQGIFRPHEIKIKKKFIKDIKRLKNKSMEENFIQDNKDLFYQSGDGVKVKNPPDDSPNDDKLGWLTIYEEGLTKQMFQLVLGITLAVGYERCLNMVQ